MRGAPWRSPCQPIIARMQQAQKVRYAWAMRFKVAVLFTLAAIGACGPSDPGATQGGLADPSVRAKLRAMALQASSQPSPCAQAMADGRPSPKHFEGVPSADFRVKVATGGPARLRRCQHRGVRLPTYEPELRLP